MRRSLVGEGSLACEIGAFLRVIQSDAGIVLIGHMLGPRRSAHKLICI